jgi:AcrR family transcriptional regulator
MPRARRRHVELDQRQRLVAAMVAAVSVHGYEATTVAHVVALSGVSRTAFYKQFANKEACMVAALDEIAARVTTAATDPWRREGTNPQRVRATLDALVDMVSANEPAARVYFLDSYAAGDAAIECVGRARTAVEQLAEQRLEEEPQRAGLPPLVVRAIAGGIDQVISNRLRNGATAELRPLVPDLWSWALTYTAPATPLIHRRVRAPRGLGGPSAAHDHVSRICAAMAAVSARVGYAATTVDDVAAEASISLSTYYDHFASKEEAFAAACDVGLARATAAWMPAFERAPDWRHGVRSLSDALLAHLSSEEAWARMGVVEALAAGPSGMERHDKAVAALAAALGPGFEGAPELPPIAAEAIAGGFYALVHDHIRRHGTKRLAALQPTATYLLLAPFVGADEAARIANEPPSRRRQRQAA